MLAERFIGYWLISMRSMIAFALKFCEPGLFFRDVLKD